MKKFLLSWFVLLGCVLSMNATEFDVNFTALTPSTTATGITISSAPFTFTADKGASSTNAPTQNATSKDIRLYANCTLKLDCANGTMTSAVFALSTAGKAQLADITASTGIIAIDVTNWTVTWTGSATSSVTLTVGATNAHGTNTAKTAGQFDFNSVNIDATVGGNIIQMPTFSVVGGNYTQAQSVELNCATAGASIYYTTDGTDPTAASTLYTTAFSVAKTTTIKAVAINGTDKSSIAEATYTFPVAVADVASFTSLDDNTFAQFSNPVTAVYQNGSNMFAKDATGYFVIYGTLSQTYNNGDVIAAGFSGTKVTYNGGSELKNPAGFTAGVAGTAVDPIKTTVDGLTVADVNKYVVLNNVTVDLTNKKLTSGSTSVPFYNSFKSTLPETDGVYDVTGIVTVYNNAPEVYPITMSIPTGINKIESTTVNNAKIYDIVGRQVSTTVKGNLYIQGNKKFIAK
jgi:hypothetical protein